MRFATEVMYVILGIIVSIVMAAAAAWAVPLARPEIWIIDYVAIAFIIGMGYPQMRDAWAADRAADRAAGVSSDHG
jgi:predicted transporter